MNQKCSQCGTVNWPDAAVCVRCQRSMTAPAELTGRDRLIAQSEQKSMPWGIYVMFGILALMVVFVGVTWYKDGQAETARIEAKAKADAEKAAADQKLWAGAQAALEKQAREDSIRMQADMKKFDDLSRMKPDFKNLKAQPQTGWYPNQKFGGANLPPPGTVYHQDKYGGMHQR